MKRKKHKPAATQDSSVPVPPTSHAWYPARLLATVAVTFGGIALITYLFVTSRTLLGGALLVLLLVPLVRVLGDALNPGVRNPVRLADYARRYLAVLFVLSLYLGLLLLLLPALVLALGVLAGALLALVTGIGVVLWGLQHWLGMDIGRTMSTEEGRSLMLAFLLALVGGFGCLGLLTVLMKLKQRIEEPFWATVRRIQTWFDTSHE
jgi:hypothetical protein